MTSIFAEQHKSLLPRSLRKVRTAAVSLFVAAGVLAWQSNCLAAGAEMAPVADEPIRPLPAAPKLDPFKVSLGAQLFNDRRLSANNAMSCAVCHDLQSNGATNRAKDTGSFGQSMRRNTPTIFNSSLNFRQFWDGRTATQEGLITEVLLNPLVMRSTWADVLAKLRGDAALAKKFRSSYPDGVQQANVIDALSVYIQSLRTPNARIDRYLQGDITALSSDEVRGYQLFKGYGCVACHQGANIGGNMFQVLGVVGKRGEYFERHGSGTPDLGRFSISKEESDKFVFRVPSLRNVAVTPPYFHDGSAKTLPDAVRVMFEYQLGRKPSEQDVDLVVKFLNTLTGEYQGRPLRSQEVH